MPPRTRRIRLTRERRRAAVSLTPLIDVVFILLVFFMLTASFQRWEHVTLTPPAERGGGGDGAAHVLIRVHPGGGLDVNGQRLARSALDERMDRYAERDEPPRVLIEPRAGVRLQRAVAVLDTVEAAGLPRARLLTRHGTGQ